MANDIDMWNDIEFLEREGKREMANDLLECFNTRYNEFVDIEKAEQLKKQFQQKYGFWGKYY